MKIQPVKQQSYEQTLAACAFRAKLWREFVANYQLVMSTVPETFSSYCEKFRERWVSGS